MDGWLTDPKGYWSNRFHKDPSSTWVRVQRVIVNHGRTMPGGEPALLKTERELWVDYCRASLVNKGWTMPLLIRH